MSPVRACVGTALVVSLVFVFVGAFMCYASTRYSRIEAPHRRVIVADVYNYTESVVLHASSVTSTFAVTLQHRSVADSTHFCTRTKRLSMSGADATTFVRAVSALDATMACVCDARTTCECECGGDPNAPPPDVVVYAAVWPLLLTTGLVVGVVAGAYVNAQLRRARADDDVDEKKQQQQQHGECTRERRRRARGA